MNSWVPFVICMGVATLLWVGDVAVKSYEPIPVDTNAGIYNLGR